MKILCVRYGSVHHKEKLQMNKANQQKYNQYKKDKAKYDKLCAKENELGGKLMKAQEDCQTALDKLTKQWQPKINKATSTLTKASEARLAANQKLKDIRRSFMDKENPDREELFKLILE